MATESRTTWLFVMMNPSDVKMKPEPVADRRPAVATSMFTTEGAVRFTADTTACEYASKSLSSFMSLSLRVGPLSQVEQEGVDFRDALQPEGALLAHGGPVAGRQPGP